jgi:hypothetical protein
VKIDFSCPHLWRWLIQINHTPRELARFWALSVIANQCLWRKLHGHCNLILAQNIFKQINPILRCMCLLCLKHSFSLLLWYLLLHLNNCLVSLVESTMQSNHDVSLLQQQCFVPFYVDFVIF